MYPSGTHQTRKSGEVELVGVLLLVALQVTPRSAPPRVQEGDRAQRHPATAIHLGEQRILSQQR